MPEVLVKNIPDYKQFGHAAKLRLNLNNIDGFRMGNPHAYTGTTHVT